MELVLGLPAFLFGAIVGSFLNVVIHRYPRGGSIAFPASHCPVCQTPIRWYDNVPILSYLLLVGRCRICRAPISLRYPLVELSNALFYVAIVLRAGLSIDSILLAALVSMTIALMYIDAEIQILPDVIDLPGVLIGVILAAVGMVAKRSDLVLALDWRDSLIGAAAGAGVIVLIAGLYMLIRGVEGMGMGDAKMLAMIGATVGWRPLYAVILLACVVGAVIGVAIALITRRGHLRFALPFGIFLGFGFLAVLFFGEFFYASFPTLRLGR